MGWLIHSNTTRKNLVADLIKDQDAVDLTGKKVGEFKTIAHCFKGNNLWAVCERSHLDGRPSIRFIALFLIRRYGPGEWGYKDMDESCGPIYYNCPVKYLDMAPDGAVNDFAKEWREEVRKLASAKQEAAKACKGLKHGDRFNYDNTNRIMEFVESDFYRVPKGYILAREVGKTGLFKVKKERVKNIRPSMQTVTA